jgi:hypothetical protein
MEEKRIAAAARHFRGCFVIVTPARLPNAGVYDNGMVAGIRRISCGRVPLGPFRPATKRPCFSPVLRSPLELDSSPFTS